MEGKKGIVVIVILSIIILGLGGYIVYDKFFQPEEEIDPVTTIGKVNIDLNALYQVGDILEHFDSAYNDKSSSYFGYIYNSKKLTAEKFDKGAALFAAMHKNFAKSNTLQSISEAQVRNDFQKIFGKYLPYEAGQMNAGANYNIVYDGTTQAYNYTIPQNTSFYNPEYLIKNIKTEIAEDSIIVTRKLFYVEYLSSGETTINQAVIYKDASKQKKFGTVKLNNGVVNLKEVISKYGSRLNTYKLTFKQNKEDDYSFYQIEKIK